MNRESSDSYRSQFHVPFHVVLGQAAERRRLEPATSSLGKRLNIEK